MSIMGLITASIGFGYAGTIIYHSLNYGGKVEGWSSLIVVALLIGGLQMIMLGILGEYLWRALDESRKRPLFVIEDELGFINK